MQHEHANGALRGLRSAFCCGVGLAALGLAMPAQAADGVTVIQVISSSNMTSTYDNAPIHATGAGAYGVYYDGDGGAPDFSVNYTGDILSDEESAVYMHTGGDVTFIGDGDFQSTAGVIYIDAGGDVIVEHTGDIDGFEREGIYVTSGKSVDLTFTGDLRSTEDGITANSYSVEDTVDVTINGSVQSDEGVGVFAKSGGDVTVTLEDGTSIAAVEEGIYADNFKSTVNSTVYTGDVTVTGQANVTSWESTGIKANGSEDVSVTLNPGSRVQAELAAIDANSYGGTVTVDVTGTFISYKDIGIKANASGNVDVTLGEGSTIQAEENGIDANTYGGTVDVYATGAITSYQGNGIRAHADGKVVVDYSGILSSKNSGIYANAYDPGSDVEVYAYGHLTSWLESGIYAVSTAGGTYVENYAGIQAFEDGIFAKGSGSTNNVVVNNYAGINADNGSGIVAESTLRNAGVFNQGDIVAKTVGISVTSLGDTNSISSVENYGDISTGANEGIYAMSAKGQVWIYNDADITAQTDAIKGLSYGNDEADTLTVETYGTLTSRDGSGIYLSAANEMAGAWATGDIYAKTAGIYVHTTGADATATAHVDWAGNTLRSLSGNGIDASSSNSSATVYADGAISADAKGIVATGKSSKVVVFQGSSIYANDIGIDVNSYSGTSFVDVGANITSNNQYGIKVNSSGAIDLGYSGTLVSKKTGINANAYGAGSDVEVYASGSLTSWLESGIVATAQGGGVWVENHGAIQAHDDGIYAKSTSNSATADVLVGNFGVIHADNQQGIFAESEYKDATVYNEGDIFAKTIGIYARSQGTTDSVTYVENYGDIATGVNEGIYAISNNGYAWIYNEGDITAQTDAIKGITFGDDDEDTLVAESHANLVSRDGSGIYLKAAHQAAAVLASGDITSKNSGIYARSEGDDPKSTAFVDWQGGTITSLSGHGVEVSSTDSWAQARIDGTIIADLDGIHVTANLDTLDSRVNIVGKGSITALNGYGIYGTATEGGVTVVNEASITGDDGGIYVFATGDRDGATAIVDNTGDIEAYSGAGIYAKSSSETVSVTQRGGTISGALGAQYGIQAVADTKSVTVNIEADGVIEDANTAGVLMRAFDGSFLNNYGTITGGPGLAVQTTGYNGSTINNYGTISGSVEFNGGMSVFNNNVGGVYNIASLTNFTGGTFYNHGILSPGGDGVVTDTAYMQANLKQGTDGVFLVDVDGQDADYLKVDGNAELAGKLQLNFLDVLQPTTVTVMSTYWLDQRELTLANLIVDGDIRYVDDTDVVVDINGYDYSPEGLNKNGNTVGDALTDAYDNGNHNVDPILTALANLTTIEDYESAIEQLTPEVYADNNLSVVQLSSLFTGRLFSCRVADGAYRFSAEGECQWFAAAGSTTEQDATSDYQGYSQKAVNIAGGGQWALSEDWRFGAGLGYTSSSSETDIGATSESSQFQGGAVVKYDHEGMMLAGAVAVGTSTSDTERTVSFGGLDETLTGTSNSTFVSARLQGSYTYQLGDAAYVKPLVDIDVTNLHFGGLQETGGSSALTLSEGNSLVATFAPSVEVGGEMALSDDLIARPYVRVGGSFSNSDGMHVVADFNGETTGFEVAGGGDTAMAKLGAGVDFLATNEISVRAYYEGAFGETTRQNTVGFKFAGQF